MDIRLDVTTYYLVLLLGAEIIGNALNLSMLLFEKRCLEEQKRTIVSLLLSSLNIAVIAFNVLILPFWFKHQLFEPLGMEIQILLHSAIVGFTFYALLSLTEMVVVKTLYVYFYTFVAERDEYLLAWILQALNLVISGLVSLLPLHESGFNVIKLLMGLLILTSFSCSLLICHKSINDQRANTAAIPTPNPSLEPLSQINNSDAISLKVPDSCSSSNILHVRPARSSEESSINLSVASRKSIIRTGRRPRTKTPPPRKSYSDDSTLPVVLHQSTDQESILYRQSPQKTNSEESKVDTISARIPMVTLTPSPSVHFAQNSVHLSDSGRSSSPTQSSLSHLSQGNFSLATPSFVSGSISSVSSVSLNFLLSVEEHEPQLAADILWFLLVLNIVACCYFLPFLFMLECLLQNVYLWSSYCLLSVVSPLFYFCMKPDHLSKVFKDVLNF